LLLELDHALRRYCWSGFFFNHQLVRFNGSGGDAIDPVVFGWIVAAGSAGHSQKAARMMNGADIDFISRVTEGILITARRPLVLLDHVSSTLIDVPCDVAAAPHGLLPVLVMAADAVYQDLMGVGFGIRLVEDETGLFGWRVSQVGGSFVDLMFSMMEVIYQAAWPDYILLPEMASIYEMSMALVNNTRVISLH
jgi:hypothetical protein